MTTTTQTTPTPVAPRWFRPAQYGRVAIGIAATVYVYFVWFQGVPRTFLWLHIALLLLAIPMVFGTVSYWMNNMGDEKYHGHTLAGYYGSWLLANVIFGALLGLIGSVVALCTAHGHHTALVISYLVTCTLIEVVFWGRVLYRHFSRRTAKAGA